MNKISKTKRRSQLQKIKIPKVSKWHDSYSVSLPQQKKHDVRTMKGFETPANASAEHSRRIEGITEVLENDTAPNHYQRPLKVLLKKLETCEGNKKKHCSSLACPSCKRRQRMGFVKTFSEFYERRQYKGIAFVTLLAKKWSIDDTAYAHPNMKLPAIQTHLKYQMKKTRFPKSSFMVGFIEAEHVEDKGRIDFHIHMLIPYHSRAWIERRLASLRNFYKKKIDGVTPAMKVAIRERRKIDDQTRFKIIAYICKSFWGRTDKYLRAQNRKVRMREPMHSVLLAFQDAHKPSQFRLLFGGRITPAGHIKLSIIKPLANNLPGEL